MTILCAVNTNEDLQLMERGLAGLRAFQSGGEIEAWFKDTGPDNSFCASAAQTSAILAGETEIDCRTLSGKSALKLTPHDGETIGQTVLAALTGSGPSAPNRSGPSSMKKFSF